MIGVLKTRVEDLGHLRQCVSEAVMKPRGKDQRAVSQLGPRQSIGYRWFDQFFAVLTVTARDDMLRAFRLGFWNVLDDACPILGWIPEQTATLRTDLQGVWFLAVDPFGLASTRSLVALLATRLLPLLRGSVLFLVRRDLTGGCAG